MAKAKNNKEKKLEDILFDCRNALRGKVEQADNRNAVMGLVFLKFAGDKFEIRRKELIKEYGDNQIFLNKPSFYLAENVFYLVVIGNCYFLNQTKMTCHISKGMPKNLTLC